MPDGLFAAAGGIDTQTFAHKSTEPRDAEAALKRRIDTLDGTALVATMRKPFGVPAEGLLVQTGRGEWT